MPRMRTPQKDDLTSQKARDYQAIKNRLFLFHLVLSLAFLAAWMVTGASRALKVGLLHFREDFFGLNAAYFFCFSVIALLFFFPLDFFEGFVLERRFGLSRQGLVSYLKDAAKKSIVSFIVGLILVEGVYFFLSSRPYDWWFWAACLWFLVSVGLARLFPQFILPLFFRSQPLAAGSLRERIFSLLARHKVPLKEVFVLDFSKKTVKANAMVAGLGRTKRIYLSDTLVNGFPENEVFCVLAHEVGHYLRRDTFKATLFGLGTALLSFYAAAVLMQKLLPRFNLAVLSDIAGLPLLALILLAAGLFLLPLQNGFSRFLERKADLFALEETHDSPAFISMMKRLGERNFAQFSPSKFIEVFLYDHPPIAQRIRMAQEVSLKESGHGI